MSTGVLRCPSCGGLNRVDPRREGASCGRCGASLADAARPQSVDDDALARLIRSSPVPVLVDFYADWCGPCRAMAPHLDRYARELAGRVIVVKVDVDRHRRHAEQVGLQGVPTLAVYRDGALRQAEAGARMGPALDQWVAPHLG